MVASATAKSPLAGWGRYPVVPSLLQRPEKLSAFEQLCQQADGASLLARGGGRSYGDAALNPHGQTLLMERFNRMLAFDAQTGRLHCEAGVSLREILDVFLPRGWFPWVSPGTKFVTVGGAIAFDVHGKNHHQDGSFCRHVYGFNLMLASGETVFCSRDENADIFWATVGGMGLTGIITEVQLSLQPVETAYIQGHTIKAQNLDDAIALFDQYEPQYQYSVAWIDCLASGAALGRSLLMFGNHATVGDLPTHLSQNPLSLPPKRRFRVPLDAPAGLLNRYTMGAFNTLYYSRQTSREVRAIADYDSFFYPLDFIWDWNRLYGKAGFVQYQCVFPTESSRQGLVEVLEQCSRTGWGSFLAVLKRFGEQEGWLSFPMPGYTLTLDMPVKPGLFEFLDQLDALVIRYGGRVYLAKDARLSAESFRAMYPNYTQWLAVKSRIDPNNTFASAMSERLNIKPMQDSVAL